MKRLFSLIITSLFFLSCTNDSTESIAENNSILPKILKVYNQDNSISYTTTIVYDKNKIVSATNNLERVEYFYDEDKIVKEVKYNFEKGREILYSETSFTYINNNLNTVINLIYGSESKCVYIYNEDGTIMKESYFFDNETSKESKNDWNEILTFANGNLIKSISNSKLQNVKITNTISYEYDNSNNAFKNVLGFNLLLDQVDYYLILNPGSANNVTKTSCLSSDDFGNKYLIYSSFLKCEYNKNGYPIKKTMHNFERGNEIIEYVY